MDRQLEQRIRELGKIIRKETYVKKTKKEVSEINGDGHSWREYPSYIEIPTYGYRYTSPWKERKKARKELKSIRLSERLSGDKEVEELISEQLKVANYERTENLMKIVKIGAGIGIAYLMFRGCSEVY